MQYEGPGQHDGTATTYGRRAQVSADRIQFRRAVTLSLMTLFMPGSAQLVAGNKRIGRIALRIWLACLGLAIVLVAIALFSRSSLFGLATNPRILTLGRWLLIAGALSWVALLLDAWRLGRPFQLPRNHRVFATGVNAGLCFITAGVMFFAAHLVGVQSGFIGAVFASSTTSKPTDGRYNILLLGTDSGPDRSGMRPDSITVASIDAKTGRTVLIGLPRNLQDIRFSDSSFMKKAFPRSFDCDGCYLNAVNTWANDHAEELGAKDKGQRTPGIQATMDAVEQATGLSLNYYALINMHGFSKLIDAVGGVTVNVRERTAIGGIGSPIRGYIPAGVQKLSGDHALWYARSRVQNDDWSRMGRQKCVMNAMLHELNPKSVLLNVEKIADSSKALLDTDIPQSDLGTFMDLALKARSQKVSTVSLVPPAIYTGNPDWDKVSRMITSAIDAAEGRKAKPKVGIQAAKLAPLEIGSPEKDPRKANQSSDLATSC